MRSLIVILLLCFTATRLTAEVPLVVADIPAVHSLTARVMGDLGTPVLLVAGPTDPHHFQLRPSQARHLAKADILFWIGQDLTPWLAGAAETLAENARIVALSEVPGTLRIAPDEGDYAPDPHLWLDPQNAIVWLDVIARELAARDPENAGTYGRNADAAKQAVADLMAETSAMLSTSPPQGIIVAHDAYDYFARRFDITIVGAVSDSDATSPGAARIRTLQQLLTIGSVACVFGEPQQNPATLAILTEGTRTKSGILDPSGTTLSPGPELYFQLIRNLARSIAGCADIEEAP